MADVWCRYCKRLRVRERDDRCQVYGPEVYRDKTTGYLSVSSPYSISAVLVKQDGGYGGYQCDPHLTIVGRLRSFLGLAIGEEATR